MAQVAFDTLKFAHRLKDSGMPSEQAEANSDALNEAWMLATRDLATKADVRELRGDMQALDSKLDRKISEVRGEISEVRGEISEVRGEISEVRGEIHAISGEVRSVRWVLVLIVALLVIPMVKSFFP
uniref:DUF1640 domain-containing protein n=1 Tax=Candidatus Kentrum sp. UNK TaxID=2126344 RepID=A0A451AGQ7_9GAMM|nr:MAG: Protein of unknown function (DUF1640) [Candidatus Kentron sp. UNK]